ncbi:hypothetical protein NQ317_000323 [Molorchus minor]|uniref:Uncharacterized protein n=1 Tax=Molorchus minor TaxID=1323400 RepID=A0ABQ9J993_9CUCU|nr:hypothetical protein NQ317_000323 [Molorchus minor]
MNYKYLFELSDEDPIREEVVDETPDPLAVVELPPLNKEVLNILGDDTSKAKVGGEIIHKYVASRLESILVSGLHGYIRSSLVKKYPPATSCPRIAPPKLNPEIKAAVSDSTIRRDKRHTEFQDQIGATLSALGKALTVLLGGSNLHLIELISDAGRIMADLHHT